MTDVSARPASASSGFPARGVGRFGELDSTRVRGPVTVAAILTAVLVGLAVAAGPTATAILLAAAALLLAVGWPVLTAPRRVVEQRTVIAATGLSCALTVAGTAGPHRLVWLPVVVAVGMIGAFFLLLLTPGGRESLTEGMSGALGASSCSPRALVTCHSRWPRPALATWEWPSWPSSWAPSSRSSGASPDSPDG